MARLQSKEQGLQKVPPLVSSDCIPVQWLCLQQLTKLLNPTLRFETEKRLLISYPPCVILLLK